MVLVPLLPRSVRETVAAAKRLGCALWLGADALPRDEIESLRAEGLDVTVLSYSLAGSTGEDLSRLLETIATHHPDETILVEGYVSP